MFYVLYGIICSDFLKSIILNISFNKINLSLIYHNLKDNLLLSLIMYMHHLIFKYITNQTFIFNLNNLYIIFLKVEYNLTYKSKKNPNK